MADAPETTASFEKTRPFVSWLFNWLYFLRFPILTAAALVGLPYLGLISDLRSLLASLFVTDATGIFRVSAVAFTTAGAILVTWRLIVAHGDVRFGRGSWGVVTEKPSPFRIRLWQALVAGGAALPVTIAMVYKTLAEAPGISRSGAVLAVILGLAAALLLFFVAALAQLAVNAEGRAKELSHEIFIVRWLPESFLKRLTRSDPAKLPRRSLRKLLKKVLGPGFFDESTPSSSGGRFLPGHGFAASLLVLSLLVFIIAGQFSPRDMPALFFVILLLMLLCWGLSGLSFLLDRYRVPVLILILLFAAFLSPNYYYQVPQGGVLIPLTPEELIAGSSNPRRLIVVATEGGGIQAAAWTAQVLTGLQGRFEGFGQAVRIISSVSGGSVGALYFVNAYDPKLGVPPKEALPEIVKMAAGNSLDDVARGLVYHDFIHTLIPLWEVGDDRGTALERSWATNCQQVCERFVRENPGRDCPINCAMSGTLGIWGAEVRAGKRPANIFNATVVENGDRLLVSNTDVRKPLDIRGRTNIARLLGGNDILGTTAARLSASFPFVSPASRADQNAPPSAKAHVVDGGYYDNYGVTSLVEWLDYALDQKLLDEVLVIQIQSFDDDPTGEIAKRAVWSSTSRPTQEQTRSGYISQLLAPLLTLLHIRTSAQASHKEIEFDLLGTKWKNQVSSALFKYRCGEAPLTWKLTECEKSCIGKCWEWQYAGGTPPDIEMVGQFLSGGVKKENRAAENPPLHPDVKKCKCG